MLWPIAASGYLFGHDMVFTPDQPLDRASLGLSSASPRAVPLDALVALAGKVIGGVAVGRLAVLLPLIVVGVGVAALLRTRSVPARLAAAGLAIWNPYVVERLDIGQWALLWGYAALPWIWLAVTATRGRRGMAGRALAIAAASITPTGGLIALGTVIAALSSSRARPRREAAATVVLAVALQLPWVLPAILSSASGTSDPAAVNVFRARAEHGGGVLLSLLSGGGIWDADVVPGSRSGPVAWMGLIALAAVAVLGASTLAVAIGRRQVAALAVLAALGLILGYASSVPGGTTVVEQLVEHVPGAGLLRDAQKWIAPLVILEALLFGAAIDRFARPVAARQLLLAAIACAAPLALLPDASSTLRTTFTPVHYPRDWAHVAELVRGGGDAAVVPDGSYRVFAWAPGRSVIDPAPRLLPIHVIVDDRLTVGGATLSGEDPRAAAVHAALSQGAAALAAQGVAWVVVERGTPGVVPELSALTLVYQGADVELYRVPPPVDASLGRSGADVAVLVVDLALVAGLAVAALGLAAAGLRRRQV